MSNRKPVSPTASTGSSISGPPRASTNSCRGHGPKPTPPINSPPDPPRLKLSRQFQRAGGRKGRLRLGELPHGADAALGHNHAVRGLSDLSEIHGHGGRLGLRAPAWCHLLRLSALCQPTAPASKPAPATSIASRLFRPNYRLPSSSTRPVIVNAGAQRTQPGTRAAHGARSCNKRRRSRARRPGSTRRRRASRRSLPDATKADTGQLPSAPLPQAAAEAPTDTLPRRSRTYGAASQRRAEALPSRVAAGRNRLH